MFLTNRKYPVIAASNKYHIMFSVSKTLCLRTSGTAGKGFFVYSFSSFHQLNQRSRKIPNFENSKVEPLVTQPSSQLSILFKYYFSIRARDLSKQEHVDEQFFYTLSSYSVVWKSATCETTGRKSRKKFFTNRVITSFEECIF